MKNRHDLQTAVNTVVAPKPLTPKQRLLDRLERESWSAGVIAVVFKITSYMWNVDGGKDWACPSQATLAADLDMSERWVRDNIKLACNGIPERGLLPLMSKTRTTFKGPNRYRAVLFPKAMLEWRERFAALAEDTKAKLMDAHGEGEAGEFARDVMDREWKAHVALMRKELTEDDHADVLRALDREVEAKARELVKRSPPFNRRRKP